MTFKSYTVMTVYVFKVTLIGGDILKKNVIITGGTGGIGKVICKKFLENNYNVYFTYYSNAESAK